MCGRPAEGLSNNEIARGGEQKESDNTSIAEVGKYLVEDGISERCEDQMVAREQAHQL